MEQGPQRDYRIVEREGRLVVEYDQGPASRGRWIPRLALPNFSFHEKGLELFRKRHDFRVTSDGNAILSAGQLGEYEKLLKLDANFEDEFYLTPAQQSLLGWFGVGTLVLIPIGMLLMLLIIIFDIPGFLAIASIVGAVHFGTKYLETQLGPIREQGFVAAATDPSAPAT